MKKKCELLNISRSSMYYQKKPAENIDHIVLNEIRDIYQETPFYGYHRIQIELLKRGFLINHKKIQRLLALADLKAIYPTKRTTIRNHEHKVFPYLLRDIIIDRPNQVWAVDITYIKIRLGFVYLICLIDVFSRRIMGWALSTFLDTTSCMEALTNALREGNPEIVNSDQGCQFTSSMWVDFLMQQNIKVSMDGKGRWADNVYIERLWRSIKYEHVYLHSFDTVQQAYARLTSYIQFYNQQRPHQSLNYHTPNFVYAHAKIPSKKELFDSFNLQPFYSRKDTPMFPKFT